MSRARSWWPWRRQTPEQAAARAQEQAATDEQRKRQERARVAAHGRLIQDLQQQLAAQGHEWGWGPDEGGAYVCGLGMVPTSVLFAVVDLDDAELRRDADPDDPGARAAVQQARAALAVTFERLRHTEPGRANP